MEKKAIIERVRAIHKTALLYGGWGIGKTHFVKNELFEDLKKDYNVVYVDARLFDSNQDVYDYVSQHILKFKDFKNVVFDSAKEIAKLGYNVAAFFTNAMFKTSMPFIEKNPNKTTLKEAISKTDKKQIYLLVDELDRVTPDTIIKTLNFVNGMSIVDDRIKILVIGNIEEINSILQKKFGYSNAGNFLHKYFEDQINVGVIQMNAICELAPDYAKYFKGLEAKFPARMVEKQIKKINNLKEKYKGNFSNDVYIVAMLGEMELANEIILHKNYSDTYITQNPRYHWNTPRKLGSHFDPLLLDLKYYKDGDAYELNLEKSKPNGEVYLPCNELLEKFRISNFDNWVKEMKFFEKND